MAKYRKKPVVIEAVQFTGNNADEIAAFTKGKAVPYGNSSGRVDYLSITTLEGTMRADINDWVIKGVKGEFYPCKPDIFYSTYEDVDEG